MACEVVKGIEWYLKKIIGFSTLLMTNNLHLINYYNFWEMFDCC